MNNSDDDDDDEDEEEDEEDHWMNGITVHSLHYLTIETHHIRDPPIWSFSLLT